MTKQIDVGRPSIGYYDTNLVDGNHGLAAAEIGKLTKE